MREWVGRPGGRRATYMDGPVAWLEALPAGWWGDGPEPTPETLVWSGVAGGICTLADLLGRTEPDLWPADGASLSALLDDWDAEALS
ncbi:MAG: hypothetical protein MR415_05445 [Coriobacteriaceae bacterium]|nr:hypothetical protein [Coriobacteriaceae bacterium]